MKVAVLVAGGLPNPTSGGGALTVYTIIRQLLHDGHHVRVVAVHDHPYFDPSGATLDRRADELRALGADVHLIPTSAPEVVARERKDLRSRLRRLVRPSDLELYPHLIDAPATQEAVSAGEPDVVFVYHFEALAASRLVREPRVALVGDPSHLPQFYRWRDGFPSKYTIRSALRLQAVMRTQPRLMVRLLRECEVTGAFAAQHAAWFRDRGVSDCRYLHTPVPDDAGSDWRRARDEAAAATPRVLLLGHLQGIVTVDGLRVFEKMLRELDRLFGRDGFTVDVVGGYEPPADLAHVFEHPAIVRHPHTEDVGTYMRRSTLLLVPTSIPLGVRVRIVTGLSYGTCIVTHTANTAGIPELVDGHNAYIASDPEALARAVHRAATRDDERRAIEARGRDTYERLFAPQVAAESIVALLESAMART